MMYDQFRISFKLFLIVKLKKQGGQNFSENFQL
jgi:hypothetical protein